MADVPLVTIVDGLPTAGTGTVQSISNITDRIGALTATKETNPDAASATELALLRGLLQSTIDATVTSGSLAAPSTELVSVIGPVTTKVTVTFNRPANTTAYTANDAVNDNATAGGGSSTELSWAVAATRGTLRRVRVKKTDQTVATPTLRLWLYDTVFASGAGDNEAFVHPATDSIGFVDIAVTTAGTDDAVGWANADIPFTGATLYGQLQTLSAFTPASGETFTVDLWYQPG